MEDKEIIDGVDVAGCPRLWNGQCTGKDNKLLGNCIDLDCELKQLKRLEQENEKFINVINDSIIEQEKQIARINCLEQENEQLEKENKVNLSRSLDLNREIQNLSAENAELKAENERLKEEKTELEEKFLTLNGKSYSYYTTLQDIKTIAEEIADTGNWLNCGYNASRANKIIDLITKAEEE